MNSTRPHHFPTDVCSESVHPRHLTYYSLFRLAFDGSSFLSDDAHRIYISAVDPFCNARFNCSFFDACHVAVHLIYPISHRSKKRSILSRSRRIFLLKKLTDIRIFLNDQILTLPSFLHYTPNNSMR
uniref:Uncharacterized protein n=1 Tax=Parascaris univalens TaxID=6257 RepID=A0A915A7X1_PARUN